MVVSSCWCKEVRKKYWIQQINLRFQSIEQLWPSSIYALDTRWWSGNGHLLQNENYHKKLRKRLCSVLTPNVEYYRFEDVALGNSLYTIHILLLSIPRKYIKSYRNMNENRKYTMLRYFIKTYLSQTWNWMKLFLHQQTFCTFGFMDVLSTAVTIHTWARIWIQLYYFGFVKRLNRFQTS